MSIRAVAWDIDGTLIDSEPLHLRTLLTTCADYCVDISDIADDAFVGVNLHDVWQTIKDRYPSNLSMQMWLGELNENYANQAESLIAIPQARKVVGEISHLGISQIVVSNSHRRIVDINLQAAGITRFIKFSLSLDDVPVGKPDPVPYRMAIRKLDLPINEIIAVEDSLSGIQSAKAAGLTVLGFSQGNMKLPTADRAIKSLTEVLDFIHKASS